MSPSNEPVATTEAIRIVLLAVLVVLEVFHLVFLTAEQTGAILGLYVAISSMLSSVARSQVTPTKNVALTHDDVAALTPPAP